MSTSSHARLRAMLATFATLTVSATVVYADGPYSYTGHGGQYDVLFIPYQDVAYGHTETVSLNLNTGNALSYLTHFAIGARGISARTGLPHGRGLAIGHMEAITPCTSGTAVAVEDFDGPGVLPNTAICYPFANNTVYRIVMNVADNDVSFTIYEREGNDGHGAFWSEVMSGGCLATGHACPVSRIEGNAGDAFVLSAPSSPSAPASWSWSASQIIVTSN
ncbi:MAG: hypothetical protein QM820_00210 [Minicystis sp.]